MEIEILAREEALRSLGIGQTDFDAALEAALERLVDVPAAELPAPREIPICLLGRELQLGDVAEIDVRFS